jgi:hypothetical protein
MKKVHRPAIMRSVGRTLAFAIEDQELMFDEHRFSNHGTGASRHCQSEHGDDQMNE